jgi:uncharacterized protein (DUF1778 family)
MPSDLARTTRIEARITPDGLAAVRRAAELQGRSISDFVVAAAQAEANRTIAESQIIRLSLEDQQNLAKAILDPPPPNAAMRRAAESHARLIKR